MQNQRVYATSQNNKIYTLTCTDGVLTGRDCLKFTATKNGTGDYSLVPATAYTEPPTCFIVPSTAGAVVTYQAAPTTALIRLLSNSLPVAQATAVLALNGITFSALQSGTNGNDTTIQITAGATAGSEVITCTDAGAITIQVSTTVSTATQVFAALMKSDADTTASLLLNAITFYSTVKGAAGNNTTIQITAGATAGSEVVTSTSAGAITIQVETGVSTATQVYDALKAAAVTGGALAFVSYVLTGTGSTAWSTAAAAHLAGGISAAGIGATKARNFVSAVVTTGATTWATAAAAHLAGGVAAVPTAALTSTFDLTVLCSEIYTQDVD